MGDKYKSDIQKPVNNPLLSGAGHGFPFETFQGTSLPVLVSQDSSSILSDHIGEPDKFVGQDNPVPDAATRLSDPLNISVTEAKNEPPPPAQSQSANQSYRVPRLFNVFFGGGGGGGGGGKPEPETRSEKASSDQQSTASTPRSYSPYVPKIQTVTPTLQVPASEPVLPSSSALDPQSDVAGKMVDVPLTEPSPVGPFQPPPQSSFSTSDQFSSGGYHNPPLFPSGPTFPAQSNPPEMNQMQTGFPPPIHDRTSLDGNMSKPPLSAPNAPPLFKGDLSKTYRLCHNKRPVYAPIPGLTLSTPQSAPFVQGSDPPPVAQPPAAPPSSVTHPPYPSSFATSQSTPNVPAASSYFGAPSVSQSVPQIDSGSGPGQFFQPSTQPVPLSSQPSASRFPPTPSPVSSIPIQPVQPPPTPVQSVIKSSTVQPVQLPPMPFQPVPSPAVSAPPQPSVSFPTPVQPNPSPIVSAPSQPVQPPPVSYPTPVQPTPPPAVSAPPQPSVSFPTPVQPIPTPMVSAPSQPPPVSFPTPVQSAASTPSQPISQSTIPSTSSTPTIPQIPAPPTIPRPTSSATQQPTSSSAPYPATVPPQSVFAPISKANPLPTESNPPVTVVNPVAVHPTPKEEKLPSPPIIPPSFTNLAHVGRTGITYRPPYHHWFYKKEADSKEYWYPFSMTDSVTLEQTYQSGNLDENTVIATDGGRYDVSIIKRLKTAVYWEETPKEVRRCSWFCKKQNESRFKPYDENTSYHLEEEYKKCVTTDTWRRKVDLPNDEYIVMYSATNIGHFEGGFPAPHGWEGEFSDSTQALPQPVKTVRRGIGDEFDIDDGEAPRVDHLVFVVHGIGSVCDLKFRTIEEAVDIFRSVSHKLIRSHFNNSMRQGLVNRIEILPISWHSYLHGDTTGLDRKLESITLKSIPRLRHFTNDTLLDILFYTSPVYCQKIVQQVGREISTIFQKFKSRNPGFNGGVSLVGHSLGSLILFDMLCHQQIPASLSDSHVNTLKAESKLTRRMSGIVVGSSDDHQPSIDYPQLPFKPIAFFALGSPIGMFITVRGIDSLGLDFKLPTCPRFFNIFHPFDPVAYRIEALINPELSNKRPVLIPHHKGRKRMHLELKETITRVGADLKQRLVDSIRSTWNTVYQLTALGRADDGLEQEVDNVINRQIAGSESLAACLAELDNMPCAVGELNGGRRVDFVLQEAPLESFNEYVSAIRSHLIYWDSEDTILMILKEIYSAEGIAEDAEIAVGHDVVGGGSEPPSPSSPTPMWTMGAEDPRRKSAPAAQPPPYGFINN